MVVIELVVIKFWWCGDGGVSNIGVDDVVVIFMISEVDVGLYISKEYVVFVNI